MPRATPRQTAASQKAHGSPDSVRELEKDIKSRFKISRFHNACFPGGRERNTERAPDDDESSPSAWIAQHILMHGSSALGARERLSAQAGAARQLVKILIKTPPSLIVKDSF